MYRHNPVVIGIDIYNLEAEAYGAVVDRPDGAALPVISRRLVRTAADIPRLEPFDPLSDGRIPQILDAAKQLQACHSGADIRIPVSGPFSIASNLVGFETLLCETIEEPEMVRNAMEWLIDGQIAFCQAVASQGLRVALFESAATPPLLPPRSFKKILYPSLEKLAHRVFEITGENIACIIGGDTCPILETLMQAGPGYIICPVETEQSQFMRKMRQFPDAMVRINMQPAVFTVDAKTAIEEAERVLGIAGQRKNVCIGSSALPFDANPEVVLRVKEYIGNNTC
jgi:uroporphyrinogen-III decarboxylase